MGPIQKRPQKRKSGALNPSASQAMDGAGIPVLTSPGLTAATIPPESRLKRYFAYLVPAAMALGVLAGFVLNKTLSPADAKDAAAKLEGIALVLGVDHLLDMGRSATNVVGNSVATVIVSKWEGQLGAAAGQASPKEAAAA